MSITCPKCGHVRTPEEDQHTPPGICPACGVVYAKALGSPPPAAQFDIPVEERTTREKVRDGIARGLSMLKRGDRPARESGNLGTCRDCGGQVSYSAKACPHCGAKPPPRPAGETSVVAVVIGLLVFGWFILGGDKDEAPRAPVVQTPAQTAKYAASTCESRVKGLLKAPATAKFPWDSPAVIDLGNNEFLLRSYVDAQNGFGALIRSNYTCRVKVTNGSASIIAVNIL